MTKTIEFRQVGIDEVIAPSDFHSMDHGKTLNPIIHPETIGMRPSDFSPDRTFWRPVTL